MFVDPARVCLAERSSGARVYVLQRVGFFLYFFFSAIFSESSQAIGLKFGHNA